jgi:DNA-binding SARP family transcriptional activator
MRGKAIGRSLPVHHLHLMGAFTLQVDGTRIHLGRREERLLAFLAMHGPCHRPFVAGSLWPNSDEV